MNASLDLEFARMHDEKEDMYEDLANTTVIENNEVAIPSTSSASIAKNHPATLIIDTKRISKKVSN